MKQQLFFKKIVIGAAVSSLAFSCTQSADDAVTSVVNEFASLPSVTGPVSTNGAMGMAGRSNAPLASTGVLLSSPGTFGSGTSPQFCENVNLFKETMREAAGPDKILCYMGAMRSSGVIPATIDIADGTTKYFRLINLPNGGRSSILSGGNSQPLVKFEITKTNGAISSFKMWSCFGGTAGSPAQSEYISQTFAGGNATVLAKYTGSESGMSFGSTMTATGQFNNGWITKNITGMRFHSFGGNNNAMELSLNQFSDVIDLSIAMNGQYNSNTYTNRFYTVAQLLGSNLGTFAVGSGSSKVNMSWDDGSGGMPEFTNTDTVSWDGDTRLNLGTASDGEYYADLSGGVVPASPSSNQTVSFSGDQAWDCNLGSGAAWVDADFSTGGTAIMTGMESCETQFLGSSDWLQCPY